MTTSFIITLAILALTGAGSTIAAIVSRNQAAKGRPISVTAKQCASLGLTALAVCGGLALYRCTVNESPTKQVVDFTLLWTEAGLSTPVHHPVTIAELGQLSNLYGNAEGYHQQMVGSMWDPANAFPNEYKEADTKFKLLQRWVNDLAEEHLVTSMTHLSKGAQIMVRAISTPDDRPGFYTLRSPRTNGVQYGATEAQVLAEADAEFREWNAIVTDPSARVSREGDSYILGRTQKIQVAALHTEIPVGDTLHLTGATLAALVELPLYRGLALTMNEDHP